MRELYEKEVTDVCGAGWAYDLGVSIGTALGEMYNAATWSRWHDFDSRQVN